MPCTVLFLTTTDNKKIAVPGFTEANTQRSLSTCKGELKQLKLVLIFLKGSILPVECLRVLFYRPTAFFVIYQ